VGRKGAKPGQAGVGRIGRPAQPAEAEVLELAVPNGIGISRALDIDAAGQASFNGGLDEFGRRKASESVMFASRTLQRSRYASCSALVIEPDTISSSHRQRTVSSSTARGKAVPFGCRLNFVPRVKGASERPVSVPRQSSRGDMLSSW
jgi:hypothetical protein